MLYDDQEDTWQMNNLVDHPEYENVRKTLHLMLEDWRARLKDAFDEPETIIRRYKPGLFEKDYGSIGFENPMIRESRKA